MVITGKGTMFEGSKAVKIVEITDGTANTLMLVEVPMSSGSWAEPIDLDIGDLSRGLVETHPGGVLVGTADGAVRFSPSSSSGQLIPMATRNGNEAVNPGF